MSNLACKSMKTHSCAKAFLKVTFHRHGSQGLASQSVNTIISKGIAALYRISSCSLHSQATSCQKRRRVLLDASSIKQSYQLRDERTHFNLVQKCSLYPLSIYQYHLSTRQFSGIPEKSKTNLDKCDDDKTKEENQLNPEPAKLGIFKRFKNAYKEYGKVLIGVHCATSVVWFGSFFYLASSGIDVVSLLQSVTSNEYVMKVATTPGVGNAAVAYLFYKLATPARYTVTLGGTHITVKKLREWGYMEKRESSETFSSFLKEGREQAKDFRDDVTDKMKDGYGNLKDGVRERVHEKQKQIKSSKKYEDTKSALSNTKDKLGKRVSTLKTKVQERIDEQKGKSS